MVSKTCLECKKEFVKKSNCSKKEWITRKFCSVLCHNKNNNVTIKCKYCKKEFTVQRSYSRGKARFCSVSCSNRWKTENGLTGFYKGHPTYKINCWWKGKEMKQQVKDKISESLIDNEKNLRHIKELSIKNRGANHWNWKGGITEREKLIRHSKEYKEWRLKVYKRDKYTCKKCKVHCSSKTIVAHHIKSFKDYPKLRMVVSNGMTVCRKCHKKIHKDIGLNTRFK